MSLESEVVVWLEELLASELFPDPAGGTSVPMVKEGDVDPKRSGAQNDEDFPFVVVRTMGGSAGSRESSVIVQLIGGIWTGENVQSGFDLIKRLNALLLTVVQNRGSFSYRLSDPSPWFYGVDEARGQQSHPYYFVTISLSFVKSDGC